MRRMPWGRSTPAAAVPTDTASFAALYEANVDDVHRYLARRVGGDLAEDLTAETFAQAFRDRASFDPTRGAERAWLFGIAGHLLSRHHRTEAAQWRALARQAPDRDHGTFDAAVVDRVDAERASADLAAALAALPPLDRDVLLLVAWADLSYAQVAEALGVSTARVRSRLHEARRVLRRHRGGRP